MDTKILNQIGLNNSEIRVYFALLELDESSVGPIIEKAKVQDSKIYSILEKLIEKGLVSFIIKNNVKHFQASNPKNLLSILKEKEMSISEQKRELEENILPIIEKRRKSKEEKQEANVYEGFEGLKSAFNLILDTLDKGEEYLVFMLGESLTDKDVITFFQNYHKKRIESGIKARLISNLKFKETINKYHKYKDMQIRFTKQAIPIGTFIFKNHHMTVVYGEKPTAFVIRAKRNYEYYKNFFEEMWKLSKR
ncbi:MAG: helix-turn-helix domain-containing protein [Nanoarchaeota archaeon]